MEITYPILEDGQRVGNAMVERMGLFLRICCKCLPQKTERYKVVLRCDDTTLDLGACRHAEGEFTLERRVSAKGIDKEGMRIEIVPEYDESFVPLYTDRPFPELRFASSARFCVKEDQPGLII